MQDRFDKIKDLQTLSAKLGIRNVAKYFRDYILNNEDSSDAEFRMTEIEIVNKQIEDETAANKYKLDRAAEYELYDDLLKEAVAEKEIGRPQKMADYIIIRNQIKAKYPKGN